MLEKLTKHKTTALVALGTAIALTAGAGTAYWLTHRVSLSEMPVGVDVVPQDALMTVSISTNEGQWRRLRQFGTPETQTKFAENLAQWRDRLLTANGYRYKEDIQPWIGDEVTIAILPPSSEPESSAPITEPEQQSTILVLPIADPGRAQKLLTDSANPGAETTSRDYKGVQIRSLKAESAEPYSFVVLDQRLIVASTDEQAIEQVVDTYKGEDSIAKAAGYSQALSQIEATQPFARLYVNVPVAKALAAENSVQPIPAQVLMPLQNNQGMTATVTLETDGIRVQGVNWLSADSEDRYRVTNNAERMPSLLPADTLMMTSGGNLKQLWQDFSEREDANAGAFTPDRLRQGIRSTTGLDLDQDLMTWMNGEFSLSLLPLSTETPDTPATPQSAGVLLMVQANDRRAADTALTKLDQAMSSRYGFRVSEAQVEGQPVVNWVSPFASLSVTRGWLDGNVAFLAIGSSLAGEILPEPDQTLAEAPAFREAIASKLDSSNGHFFVDLDRLTGTNGSLPFPLPPQTADWLKAMQSIGVTAAIQDERSTRFDVLVQLDKTENPAPLPSPTAEASPEASPEAEPSPSPSAPSPSSSP